MKCVRSSSDPTWLVPFRTRRSWPVSRSGLAISSNHSYWLGWEQRPASISDDEGPKPRTLQREPSPERPMPSRSFGAVYRRKRRQRPPPEPEDLGNGDEGSDRRFGLVFTRKHKRAKLAPFGQGGGNILCSSSRELASSVGLLEDAHFLGGAVGSRSAVLVVLVDASSPGSSSEFSRFLLPVLLWLRWRERSHVQSLASFLLASPAVATAFALHGVGLLLYDGERRTVIGCKTSYVKQFRYLFC
ncbi:Enhancer of polycomb-like protein [Hordeum vulgare]|nr:Enhancer of polycomb-like protein [Hordeum vulgare]